MIRPSTDRPSPHPLPDASPSRAGRVAALLAAAGVVLGLGGLAAPAAAHDELVGTTPADGASVEVPPAAVELTFGETPLALGSQVQVTGPDGEVVNAGDPQITDTVVSQPLASDLPAGDYTVVWRVTSSDGHPISGDLGFTALAGTDEEEPAATPEPAPADTASPEPGATAAPEPTPTEAAVAPPDPGAADGAGVVADPSPGAAPWVVGALVVLLVGGTLWWVARRRATTAPQA